MEYFIIVILLLILMLLYFRVANHYNIIDKPNHRSAHTTVTLRGGGIVYFFALLLFIFSMIWSQQPFPHHFWIFFVGFFTISAISFLDDIIDLSPKVRLFFHFTSVSFLLYYIQAFQEMPLWVIPFLYIFIIGILNAYNFMDGINGMSGLYSLLALGTLWYINLKIFPFVDENFIVYPLFASFVFLFFNFRKKAKCFLGDIGSIGIAFWILSLLGLLIIQTQNPKYILLLGVYGVEVIYTIIERLKLRENIFEAHRRHLYQLLVHEKKISHLWVSTFYTLMQLLINVMVLILNLDFGIIFLVILIPVSAFYLILKFSIKSEMSKKQ